MFNPAPPSLNHWHLLLKQQREAVREVLRCAQ